MMTPGERKKREGERERKGNSKKFASLPHICIPYYTGPEERKESRATPAATHVHIYTGRNGAPTQHFLKHCFKRCQYNVVDYACHYWGVDWRRL